MSRMDLCAVADLPEGQVRVFTLPDGLRVVAARSGATVLAVEDRCSHDDGELGDGRLVLTDGVCEVECPRHGARFDMATGRATRMPAVAPIEAFAAGLDGDRIWVEAPEY